MLDFNMLQKWPIETELETQNAIQEMNKFEKRHQTEIQTVNRLLAESRLPNEALPPSRV